MLERTEELQSLDAALARAREGYGTTVLIEGEPGSGKSALLSATRARAAQQGLTGLVARASELERSVPFGVARQLLERAPVQPDWAIAEKAPVGGRRLALLGKLYSTVAELVGPDPERPALITIDDLQWSDEPSLGFVAHLALRLEHLPVALVAAVRTGDGQPAEARALVENVRSAPGADVLRLEPLSGAAVAVLVREALGDEVSEPLCLACARASGGNPFYLWELLRTIAAEPSIPAPDRVREITPDAVLRSVMVRLGRLGPDSAALARALSVLGEDTLLRDAAELANLEGRVAEGAADALAGASIFARGDPLAFSHPLIGSTLRADMGAFELAHAHRRAAQLLERGGADTARVAAHLLFTRSDGDSTVVDTLEAAADAAVQRGDPATAARALERALLEPPAPDRAVDLTLKLAQVEAMRGFASAAEHLEDALPLISEPTRRAEVLASLATVTHLGGDFRAAAELARRGREELPPGDPREARLTAIEVGAMALHPDLQQEAETALAPMVTAARAGRLPSEPALMANVAARMAQSDPPQAVKAIAEAAVAGDPLIDDEPQGTSIGWLGSALDWVDELEFSERWLNEAIVAAQRRGAVMAESVAAVQRSWTRLHRGRLDGAIADAEHGLEVYRYGWLGSPWSTPVLASAHVARGDLRSAAAAIAVGERADPGAPDHARLLEARAELELARGDPAAALASALEAGRSTEDRYGSMLPRLFEWRRLAALASQRLGREETGLEFLAPALAILRRIGPARQLGAGLTAAGVLRNDDRGVELLTEAAALLQSSPADLTRAQTLVELGAALRRRGRRNAAKEPLYAALELANEHGARPLVDRAREELRSVGARPRRAARTGIDSLTPSERRVAERAARGLSTPQVAHELQVTRKTVETHLGRIYRKLDISGRGELAPLLTPQQEQRHADHSPATRDAIR